METFSAHMKVVSYLGDSGGWRIEGWEGLPYYHMRSSGGYAELCTGHSTYSTLLMT
jgi:hypothetical protein